VKSHQNSKNKNKKGIIVCHKYSGFFGKKMANLEEGKKIIIIN
jgi:hypothetical protein